jgi:hypothetical protein
LNKLRLIAIVLAAVFCLAGSVNAAGIDSSGNGLSQADLVSALYKVQNALNNYTQTNVGLAVGSPTSGLTITATPTYLVGCQFYTATAPVQISFSSGHVALGASQQCIFMVCLSSAGAWSTVQGPILPSYETEKYPSLTDAQTPIGAVKVVTSSVGSFTPGTTLLGASGVTATYRSLARRPLSLSGL